MLNYRQIILEKCGPAQLAAKRLTVGAVAFGLFVAIHSAVAEPLRLESIEQLAQNASVQQSSPTAEQVDGWINSLQNDAYAVRQAAAGQLLAAGPTARGPLTEVADSPDPEARAAARRLVALIDKAEFDHRLHAFAADIDGKQGLSLPGWEQYQKLVGGDADARALFVEMQQHEAGLLSEAFDPGRGLRKKPGEDRLIRLLRSPVTSDGRLSSPSLGTCATMIFLGTLSDAEASDQVAMYLPRLMQRPPVQQALQKASRQDPLRRLVVAWVVECPNRSAAVVQQRLGLALILEVKEALPLALDVAQSGPAFITVHPIVRASALILVARLGDRSDADKLEPLLEDATVCMTRQVMAPPGQIGQVVVGRMMREIQIRDVALVAMLQLTGQDPAAYGYRQIGPQSPGILSPESLIIENEDQRATAIAKWRDWKSSEAAAQKSLN